MTYFRKKYFDLYHRMTKFSGAFPKRLWGRKKLFNACSGLPSHRRNYCKMLKFDNKKNFQSQLPLPTVILIISLYYNLRCKGYNSSTDIFSPFLGDSVLFLLPKLEPSMVSLFRFRQKDAKRCENEAKRCENKL
jgi:hypothetical protein